MFTIQRVETISKKEFAAATLNKEDETFVIYIPTLSMVDSSVHPSRQAQISSLDIKKVTIPSEYADYTNVFSPNSAAELLKLTGINDHPIDLTDDKQPPYSPIYSLRPVKFEMLKTYIETNLANGFIRPSMSPAGASILFIRRKDNSF